MLRIEVPPVEFYNSEINEFFNIEGATLELEHSLVAISKWEAKWHKAFFGKSQKTQEEVTDYIRCMCLNADDVDPLIFSRLPADAIQRINEYVEDPQTATTIWDLSPEKPQRQQDTVTNELIYYWMIALQIPFECQYWHINHLLTLIRVCNVKNDTHGKKIPEKDLRQRYAEINAARRKALNTKG